jgi:uncharacterized protein YaaW (UPF0174 family)
MEQESVEEHFKFHTLPNASGTVANIFIHGYSAGHDLKDRRLLSRSVPTALQDCVNVFAFWPSGHFAEVSSASRSAVMGAIRAYPPAVAAVAIGDRALHFTRMRTKAERMGKLLFEQLGEYLGKSHPSVTRINLIGHSLGGRLIVSALNNVDPGVQPGLIISDVMLLAAAVKASPDDALRMKKKIAGRLINVYSKADRVLLLNMGETSLGRNEVEYFENVHMETFGHLDYWKNLSSIMTRTAFAGFQPNQLGIAGKVGFGDHVLNDLDLYHLLEKSPSAWTGQVIKHLKSSSWTSLKDDEPDPVYACVRELQLVGGHCVANLARRRGICYSDVLSMLADHYDLSAQRHACGNVIEMEVLLVSVFFQHAFREGHLLAGDPLKAALALSADEYFNYVDELAERITIASYFKSPARKGSRSAQIAGTAVATIGHKSGAAILSAALPRFGLLGAAAGAAVSMAAGIAKGGAGRTVTNVKTALKPGYSALIPAVAVIFYARLQLGDESLM